MNMNYTLYDNDGEEHIVLVPARWIICPCCDGNGSSSAHLGVIDPQDWSPEELDDYFSGGYDKPCTECKGEGKLKQVDYVSLEENNLALLEVIERQEQEEYDHQLEVESERRMGA